MNKAITIIFIIAITGAGCEFSDKQISTDTSNTFADAEDIGHQEESEVVEVNEPTSWTTDH